MLMDSAKPTGKRLHLEKLMQRNFPMGSVKPMDLLKPTQKLMDLSFPIQKD